MRAAYWVNTTCGALLANQCTISDALKHLAIQIRIDAIGILLSGLFSFIRLSAVLQSGPSSFTGSAEVLARRSTEILLVQLQHFLFFGCVGCRGESGRAPARAVEKSGTLRLCDCQALRLNGTHVAVQQRAVLTARLGSWRLSRG